MLYRRYPEQWALGTAGARGKVVVHGRSTDQPDLDEIDAAFDKIKEDKSLIGAGFVSATGAAAALERRTLKPGAES